MSSIDRKAIEEYGIPELTLMENAGRTVAEEIIKDLGGRKARGIAVICGKGNNGGDGFVTARILFKKYGKAVTIFAPHKNEIRSASALKNYAAARSAGVKIKGLLYAPSAFRKNKFDIVADALFGIGFKGELPPLIREISKAAMRSGATCYAVDVPSGLNATTGKAAGHCFRAQKTVTFGLAKTGFYLKDGPRVTGKVIVRNIGFSSGCLWGHA